MTLTTQGSELVGKERDDILHDSLAAVMQSFHGRDLYPSLEAKAAHLLYFLVKNHFFVDGKKRIATALFLWSLERNGMPCSAEGSKWVADNTLVALQLWSRQETQSRRAILLGRR
jgi:prophage maintenance system killer protein